MPRMTLTCHDCGRTRPLYKMFPKHAGLIHDDAPATIANIRIHWLCEGGCKPAPGGFWDRLGQSTLKDIFHGRLFKAKEPFDD